MEKITRHISKNFPQVKLYLDDLENIIEILKNEGFKKIEIITPSYKYSDSELATIASASPILEIKFYDPFHISIKFNDSYGEGVRIYSETDSPLAEGLIQKIGKLLISRKRKIFSIFSNFKLALLIIIFIQGSTLLLYVKNITSDVLYFISIAVSIVISALMGFLDSGKSCRKNIFYYKKRDDQPSFWTRKKDEIVVSVITAIIVVIITLIATKLIG